MQRAAVVCPLFHCGALPHSEGTKLVAANLFPDEQKKATSKLRCDPSPGQCHGCPPTTAHIRRIPTLEKLFRSKGKQNEASGDRRPKGIRPLGSSGSKPSARRAPFAGDRGFHRPGLVNQSPMKESLDPESRPERTRGLGRHNNSRPCRPCRQQAPCVSSTTRGPEKRMPPKIYSKEVGHFLAGFVRW